MGNETSHPTNESSDQIPWARTERGVPDFTLRGTSTSQAQNKTENAGKSSSTKNLTYTIATGELKDSDSGKLLGKGYSGSKAKGATNDPDRVHEKFVGPIPPGEWSIGEARKSKNTGPVVFDLKPQRSDMTDRTDMQIHGDSKTNPGNASKGCIIMGRPIRETISKEYAGGTLTVVPGVKKTTDNKKP